MGATRSVQYASVSNPGAGKTIYSSASTRQELYNEFAELEIMSKGMKARVRDANDPQDKGYELSTPDTRLPEGNFVLYFLVDKNDSGK